ncbi:MAG: hypothetical protein J6V44_01695 [Methanobrevibacter sp.]|nr:hypothetical protein [Methanobrevibacter sp.]
MSYPELRPEYATKTFAQVYSSYEEFKEDYDALITLVSGGVLPLTNANVQATFYLLFARYGNNPIVNFDITQFKMKLMSVIATYGPVWEKKKAIQKSLRDLTEAELLQGAKQIYNHAFNPSTEPSTQELEELTHINDQNVTNNKKAKMEAYSILWANLHVDATDEYLNKFKNCFSRFVGDQCPILFVVEDEE